MPLSSKNPKPQFCIHLLIFVSKRSVQWVQRPPPPPATSPFFVNKRGNILCFHCRDRGHFTRDCRDLVRCFRCGRFGHKRNSCEYRSYSLLQRSSNSFKENGIPAIIQEKAFLFMLDSAKLRRSITDSRLTNPSIPLGFLNDMLKDFDCIMSIIYPDQFLPEIKHRVEVSKTPDALDFIDHVGVHFDEVKHIVSDIAFVDPDIIVCNKKFPTYYQTTVGNEGSLLVNSEGDVMTPLFNGHESSCVGQGKRSVSRMGVYDQVHSPVKLVLANPFAPLYFFDDYEYLSPSFCDSLHHAYNRSFQRTLNSIAGLRVADGSYRRHGGSDVLFDMELVASSSSDAKSVKFLRDIPSIDAGEGTKATKENTLWVYDCEKDNNVIVESWKVLGMDHVSPRSNCMSSDEFGAGPSGVIKAVGRQEIDVQGLNFDEAEPFYATMSQDINLVTNTDFNRLQTLMKHSNENDFSTAESEVSNLETVDTVDNSSEVCICNAAQHDSFGLSKESEAETVTNDECIASDNILTVPISIATLSSDCEENALKNIQYGKNEICMEKEDEQTSNKKALALETRKVITNSEIVCNMRIEEAYKGVIGRTCKDGSALEDESAAERMVLQESSVHLETTSRKRGHNKKKAVEPGSLIRQSARLIHLGDSLDSSVYKNTSKSSTEKHYSQ